MWKSAQYVKVEKTAEDVDDWETDPDFTNDVSEQDQRWGSKTVEGSGRTAAAINLDKLRDEVSQEDFQLKEKFAHQSQKDHSIGFGGKFGVQSERVDSSAVGWEYHEKMAKHSSQTDSSKGFGGKFGVEKERVDQSAVGFEYHEKVEKHPSQIDGSKGFGGKFGVEKTKDRSAVGWEYHEKVEKHSSQVDGSKGFGGKFGVEKTKDSSAVGWEHHEKVEKHPSQVDASKGFGGKFGVENTKDSSAVGWEHHEKVEKHPSQVDASKGFGGKFGVQKERVDQSAVGFEHHEKVSKHSSQVDGTKGFGGKFGVEKTKDKSAVGWEYHEKVEKHQSQLSAAKTSVKSESSVSGQIKKLVSRNNEDQTGTSSTDKTETIRGDAKSLRAKFENFAKQDEEESKKKLESEKQKRIEREKAEKENARKAEEDRLSKLKEDDTFGQKEVPEKDIDSSSDDDEPVKSPQMNKIGVSVFPVLQSASPPKVSATASTPAPSTNTAQTVEQSVPEEIVAEVIASDENRPNYIDHQSSISNSEHAIEATVHQNEVDEWQEKEDSIPLAPTDNASMQGDQGITAIALYDYEAAEHDEISFLPDDIVTNIEMIDEGWWRGHCHGKVGLFPANYVKLNQ